MKEINEIMKKHLDPGDSKFKINALIFSEKDARAIQAILSKTLKQFSKVSEINVMKQL